MKQHRYDRPLRRTLLGRAVCLLCVAALCLGMCVGCTSEELTAQITALRAELTDALQQIDALHESDAERQAEIEALKLAREEMQAELDTLVEALGTTEATLNALIDLHAATEQALHDLTEVHAQTESTLQALSLSHTATEQELDALMATLTATQAEMETLQTALATAQREITSLRSSHETMQQEIEHLEQQLRELQDLPPAPEEPEDHRIRIYIDQGHNPTNHHNSGAVGNGLYEQDLTYEIGILLAELLEQDGRFVTCLSRPTADTVLGHDNTSSLQARVEGAEAFEADYFISLHVNSFTSDAAHGIEVLVAEEDGISHGFGSMLLNGLVTQTGLRNRGMKLRPELYVLKNATMPAALVEMGFISNPTDAALLDQSPELFARGIYAGILTYFGLPPV